MMERSVVEVETLGTNFWDHPFTLTTTGAAHALTGVATVSTGAAPISTGAATGPHRMTHGVDGRSVDHAMTLGRDLGGHPLTFICTGAAMVAYRRCYPVH